MSKKYNISKKSDMKKFTKDLEKIIKSESEQIMQNKRYDVNCPHCDKEINIAPGKSKCPFCNEDIDFTLNINYD